IASAIAPATHGQGDQSHRRRSGTRTSQVKMLRAKKAVVYFENMPKPKAAPTASHHWPLPLSSTFARKKRSRALDSSTGMSEVAAIEPIATARVRLNSNAAVAPTLSLRKRIAPARQIAQVAGMARRSEQNRTP